MRTLLLVRFNQSRQKMPLGIPLAGRVIHGSSPLHGVTDPFRKQSTFGLRDQSPYRAISIKMEHSRRRGA